MTTYKTIFLSLLIAIVAIVETIAVYAGHNMAIVSILSTIPIYIICRIDVLTGLIAYLAIGVMLLMISPHQMMFFICTNGLVGLSLGFAKSKTEKFFFQTAVCSFLLFCGVCIIINIEKMQSLFYKSGLHTFGVIIFCTIYSMLFNVVLLKIYGYLRRTLHFNFL